MSGHTLTPQAQEAYIRESYYAARLHGYTLLADLQQQHALPLTPITEKNIPFMRMIHVLASRMWGAWQLYKQTGKEEYLTKGVESAQRFERYYSLVTHSPRVAQDELTFQHEHPLLAHASHTHPDRFCPQSTCSTEFHLDRLEELARQG